MIYIADNTKMPVPPAYWLQRLSDYDSELRVFPSRMRPHTYVLARRMQHRVNTKVFGEWVLPDTAMCLDHGCSPVCLIQRHGSGWSIDNIIRSLAARDIWAQGGADAVVDRLDAADAADVATVQAENRENMWTRAGDAWRSYQARTGQRSKLSYGHQTRQERRADQTAPLTSGSTATSGLVIAH